MRRIAILVLAASACDETETTPPWQLDHDRIAAIRSSPPGIAPGEVAILEALVAHAGAPTTVEVPRGATAAFAPGDLFTAVHFNIDHWQVDGPDQDRLDVARSELGLPAGALVPLEVKLQFGAQPLYATKIVMLGEARANPTIDPVTVNGAAAGVEIAIDGSAELLIEAPETVTVRWLTSCGTLVDAELKRARLTGEGSCDGELVVVVRDLEAGSNWQVWPLHIR